MTDSRMAHGLPSEEVMSALQPMSLATASFDQVEDEHFITMAIDLAAEGRGHVSPNPLVGAVLVQGGVIVGWGTHRYIGARHAEVIAIQMAGTRARGATIYTNLEPCCHFGRTPPCVNAIIESGITRVVSSMADPNPLVAGRGFERLSQSGIVVRAGLGQSQAERLNEQFVVSMRKGRPFLHFVYVAPSLITKPGAEHHPGFGGEIESGVWNYLGSLRSEYDGLVEETGWESPFPPAPSGSVASGRHRPLLRACLDCGSGLSAALEEFSSRKILGLTVEGGYNFHRFLDSRDLIDKLTLLLPSRFQEVLATGKQIPSEAKGWRAYAERLIAASVTTVNGFAAITGYPQRCRSHVNAESTHKFSNAILSVNERVPYDALPRACSGGIR